jgi:hypothetical protein
MSEIARPRQVFVPLIGILCLLFGAIGSFGRQASIPNSAGAGVANGHSNVVPPEPQAAQESSKTPSAQAADADYVGSEICKTCHEELYKWELRIGKDIVSEDANGEGQAMCQGETRGTLWTRTTALRFTCCAKVASSLR